MKTYSIGRDLSCDIVINDSTDVISRRHALLNITPSGKMTIIDQSSNGTYVNGIRITQNVPVPVTRKDIISLAHVAKLDWSQVPKANQVGKYVIAAVIALVVVIGAIFAIKGSKSGSGNSTEGEPSSTGVIDSTLIKQKEAARIDSLKTSARPDSTKTVTHRVRKKPTKPTKTVSGGENNSGTATDTKLKENEDKSKTESGKRKQQAIL